MGYAPLRMPALVLIVLVVATTNVVAQMVAAAPGPAVAMTMSGSPLTQSSPAVCRAKLGGNAQTLIGC